VTFNEPIDPASFSPAGVTAPMPLTLAGFYDTAGAADYVEVVGSLAYVGDGSAGLRIIDVSNPAAPVERSCLNTPGTACGVQVVGSLAYLADGLSGLRVIDVSDPSAPVDLGGCNAPGTAYDVQVIGTLAYVADGSAGLRIFDVSNPALAPVAMCYYDTSGTAYAVQVVGSLAYVADGSAGLRIIDVSDPAAPVELGFYDTAGTAYDVQVIGTLAYVADDSAGLRIIDVSSPSAPVLLGTYDTSGTARGVQVAGALAYVADGLYGLEVINVSSPATPVHSAVFNTPGSARSVKVIGTLAYVSDDSSGLRIVQVAQAAQSVTRIDDVTYRVQFPDQPVDGLRQFTVAPGITDLAGNAMDQDGDGVGGEKIDDACSVGFIADTKPPGGPSSLSISKDTGYSSSDGVTSQAAQTFTWSAATDANGLATYQYRLDGGPWVSTADRAVTLTLADGPHSFDVRAVDNAGNAGTVKSKTVTIDLTGPLPAAAALHGPMATIIGPVDALNGGLIQRSKVTTLRPVFNETVKLGNGPLTITNAITGKNTGASPTLYNATTGAWNLAGLNLPDGIYTAGMPFNAFLDIAGNAMPTGLVLWFHVLTGDVTGDGRVNAMDYLVQKKNLGRRDLSPWSGGDLDGDGDVDAVDVLAMTGSMGKTLQAIVAAGGQADGGGSSGPGGTGGGIISIGGGTISLGGGIISIGG